MNLQGQIQKAIVRVTSKPTTRTLHLRSEIPPENPVDKRRFRQTVGGIALDLGGFQARVLQGIDKVPEELMRVFLTAYPEVFIQSFQIADDSLGGDGMTGALPTGDLLLLLLLMMMMMMMVMVVVVVVVVLAIAALPSSSSASCAAAAALACVHAHDQVTHKAKPPSASSSTWRTLNSRGQ